MRNHRILIGNVAELACAHRPDCYGIGYGTRDNTAGFCVSSFGRDNATFLRHLEEVLFYAMPARMAMPLRAHTHTCTRTALSATLVCCHGGVP